MALLVLALLGTIVTGCSSSGTGHGTAAAAGTGGGAGSGAPSSAPATRSSPATPPATFTLNPANGAADVNPASPISVSSAGGRLTDVALTNATGTAVKGAVAADGTTWTSAEPLGYDKTYSLVAHAVNAVGAVAASTSTFSTLKPANMTLPYINTTGGSAIQDGGTYGVGMVVAVHWDEKVDRAKAEKTLQVTTTPAVTGSWYWMDDQNVHWRPQNYYASGTKVTVTAKDYGVDVGAAGEGLYGQQDVSTSFVIGAKHVSIADDTTHQVAVYFNDQLMRSMPTSMGRGGSVDVNGTTISFWTQPGTYTVIGQGNPVLMDSSTYGLPVNSKLGYKENIYWATQISTDGVYLHELDTTVWAQGNTDTSHGCLNLNRDNAQWFYQNAQIGDVVQVVHTGGAPLEVWQNGDWTVPWDQWVAGSALH